MTSSRQHKLKREFRDGASQVMQMKGVKTVCCALHTDAFQSSSSQTFGSSPIRIEGKKRARSTLQRGSSHDDTDEFLSPDPSLSLPFIQVHHDNPPTFRKPAMNDYPTANLVISKRQPGQHQHSLESALSDMISKMTPLDRLARKRQLQRKSQLVRPSAQCHRFVKTCRNRKSSSSEYVYFPTTSW